MADIEKIAPDQVWCGGDIAWGGPWAHECIEHVRSAGWTTVKGNTDIWITGDPQGLESDEQRQELEDVAAAHNISPTDAEWLVNLPFGHQGPGSILLVHGTPQSPFRGPMPDDPAVEFAPYMDQASVVLYGHVHHAFVRRLADGTIVCNTGSVGMPKDGELATYLLLRQDGPEVILSHRRVSYDRERAISEAKRVGGPVGERFLRFSGA